MRAMRLLLAAVIVMGVMIVAGTAVLVGTVVHRALHGSVAASGAPVVQPLLSAGQPAGTRIASVTRQSDTRLAVMLTGGGIADRLLIWDPAAGRIVATLTLAP